MLFVLFFVSLSAIFYGLRNENENARKWKKNNCEGLNTDDFQIAILWWFVFGNKLLGFTC